MSRRSSVVRPRAHSTTGSRLPEPCARADPARLGSYGQIVDHYRRTCRDDAIHELDYFGMSPSYRTAIRRAALGEMPGGRRHAHQRRLKADVLEEADRRLRAVAADLQRCSTFAELHGAVGRTIRSVAGVGPLAVFDVAVRIGAYLRLEPDRVYLHAGAAEGARRWASGVAPHLAPQELPPPFRQLTPRDRGLPLHLQARIGQASSVKAVPDRYDRSQRDGR